MKAYIAKDITFRHNKSRKGLQKIYKLIESASKRGLFKIDTLVYFAWGKPNDLVEKLKLDGYDVTTYYKQTGPNDSDDYLHISWE